MVANISGFLYFEFSGVMYGAIKTILEPSTVNTTVSGQILSYTCNFMSNIAFLYTAAPPRFDSLIGFDVYLAIQNILEFYVKKVSFHYYKYIVTFK